MVVTIKIKDESFSSILAGLYVTYHNANLYAIPNYVWLMLGNALTPYMDNWRYDVQSLEDWIANYLLITAKEVCTVDELKQFKKNTIYLEALNGNMALIITGDIIWEENELGRIINAYNKEDESIG